MKFPRNFFYFLFTGRGLYFPLNVEESNQGSFDIVQRTDLNIRYRVGRGGGLIVLLKIYRFLYFLVLLLLLNQGSLSLSPFLFQEEDLTDILTGVETAFRLVLLYFG